MKHGKFSCLPLVSYTVLIQGGVVTVVFRAVWRKFANPPANGKQGRWRKNLADLEEKLTHEDNVLGQPFIAFLM